MKPNPFYIRLALIMLGLGIIGVLAIMSIKQDPRQKDLERLEKHFGVPIPTDASELDYNYSFGRLYYLELSFKAPPESMDRFTQAICEGVLYQGYDPYNKVDGKSIPGKVHLIRNSLLTYYSYSPDAPDTYWGNICGATNVILVDKSAPTLYHLKFESIAGCDVSKFPPCFGGGNYIPIAPAEGGFMMVIGMDVLEGKNQLITQEVCVEMRGDYNLALPDPDYLLDAAVEIYVDGQFVMGRQVAEGAHGFYLATSEDADITSHATQYYNDCFKVALSNGSHSLLVEISALDDSKISYPLEFEVNW